MHARNATPRIPGPALRRHVLREALPSTVRLLATRRADAIEAGFIDDYVALDWLEWCGGTLKLTVIGENICKQLSRLDQPELHE